VIGLIKKAQKNEQEASFSDVDQNIVQIFNEIVGNKGKAFPSTEK